MKILSYENHPFIIRWRQLAPAQKRQELLPEYKTAEIANQEQFVSFYVEHYWDSVLKNELNLVELNSGTHIINAWLRESDEHLDITSPLDHYFQKAYRSILAPTLRLDTTLTYDSEHAGIFYHPSSLLKFYRECSHNFRYIEGVKYAQDILKETNEIICHIILYGKDTINYLHDPYMDLDKYHINIIDSNPPLLTIIVPTPVLQPLKRLLNVKKRDNVLANYFKDTYEYKEAVTNFARTIQNITKIDHDREIADSSELKNYNPRLLYICLMRGRDLALKDLVHNGIVK